MLEQDAAAAYNAMYKAAQTDGVTLRPTGSSSSYRRCGSPGDYPGTYGTQHYFYGAYLAGGNLAAKPCTSNHGLGKAIDFAAADMWNWVAVNGGKYGWKKIEAFSEPWHYNFVGGVHFKPPSTRPEIWKRGQNGPWVESLQEDLKYWLPGVADISVDGDFGAKTDLAVKRFQYIHDLVSDGLVGDSTRDELHKKNVLLKLELQTVNQYWLKRRYDDVQPEEERKWIANRCVGIRQVARNDLDKGKDGWQINRRADRLHVLERTLRNIKL